MGRTGRLPGIQTILWMIERVVIDPWVEPSQDLPPARRTGVAGLLMPIGKQHLTRRLAHQAKNSNQILTCFQPSINQAVV